MRAQIAIEAVIIIAFVFSLMIPIFYLLFTRSDEIREELRLTQAKRVLDSLVASINVVGVLGPSGSATIELDFPERIFSVVISGREIILKVESALGPIDIARYVPYAVDGKISPAYGKKKVKIYYDEETEKIIISEVM